VQPVLRDDRHRVDGVRAAAAEQIIERW